MSRKRGRESKIPGIDGAEETLEDLSRLVREKSPNGHRIEPFDETTLMENVHLVNAYYDRNLPGEAGSERRVMGSLYSFFKRIARRITSWYVNPALDNQRLFNAYVTRSINEMKRYLDHLQINEDILSTIMHRDLALFRANILFLNKYLERRMVDFENELALARTGGGTGVAMVERQLRDNGGDGENLLNALDILALEQRVHGSPRMVKDRQQVYLQYFRGCRNVLVIGTGRGELLQLLVQQGIPARGTDTNATLVDYCRDQDLDVSQVNPLEFLEAREDSSLDGIFLSRFAGHQPPSVLIRMLNLCRQKLQDEGILVIETPNPFSLYTVASYALEDSDRIHPLHPETLKLLCLSYDFVNPEVMFLNPLPPEEHLEDLEIATSGAILDPREQEIFHHVNQNFRKINRILFSHRDFALVTKRGWRDSA